MAEIGLVALPGETAWIVVMTQNGWGIRRVKIAQVIISRKYTSFHCTRKKHKGGYLMAERDVFCCELEARVEAEMRNMREAKNG